MKGGRPPPDKILKAEVHEVRIVRGPVFCKISRTEIKTKTQESKIKLDHRPTTGNEVDHWVPEMEQ